MVLRNLIFEPEVVEQGLGTGVLTIMSSKPPKMAIQRSIRNSRLLITFLHRTHQHQLGDFFNSYRRSHLFAAVL